MNQNLKSWGTIQKIILVLLFLGYFSSMTLSQQKITNPAQFFGFKLGSDKKIARWDKIVDYFQLLAKESDCLKVINMGPSTMGHPFLLVIISSADNLANLERLRQINAKISDPRSLSEKEIKRLVTEGKSVICQSMSLHATEIGGTQMAPELAYDLLSRSDEETKRILANVIFLMIPCFNPDGQIMVTDWYYKTLGKAYEGSNLPWLYHKYAGHDNNRDGDFINLVESKYAAKILYTDWHPQAYLDHHQMGSYGARLYIPPYCDPIRPYADPLIWREISWYGAHMAYKLEEEGKAGILNAAQFPGWGHFGWHWITPFHNIAGMLTESASVKLATPIYIHPEQLRGQARQFPEYKPQTSFPHPWPGGWWRLRDIVEQQKIAAWALLDLAARNKETVLWNAYLKAKRQIERGAKGQPKAFIIPASQHDPLTMIKMINTLLLSGLEIKQATQEFRVANVIYPQGSFLISLAQPKRGLIRNLLGRTFYPDNEWTRAKDSSPLRPYDLATHTMNEFMGVKVEAIHKSEISGDFQVVKDPIQVSGKVEGEGPVYVVDGRLNDSFKAVNLLLNKAIAVRRLDKKTESFRPGDFIISCQKPAFLKDIAQQTGVDFKTLKENITENSHQLKRMRIGMYQRYWGGNMDEGWTRFLLEQFAFPYKSLLDEEIKKGNLRQKYDVIILPDDSPETITGEIPPRYRRYLANIPLQYRSGLGQEGLKALKEFVNKGGRLVTLGQACLFAIEKFDLNITNVVADLDSKEFFCPGSTLRVTFDNSNPLAYGMSEKGLVLFWSSPALAISPSPHNERYQTIVRYQEKDLLQSGWLIGEKHLANKAAMVRAECGQGCLILISFRTQFRSQTHGTFKLLFNALLD